MYFKFSESVIIVNVFEICTLSCCFEFREINSLSRAFIATKLVQSGISITFIIILWIVKIWTSVWKCYMIKKPGLIRILKDCTYIFITYVFPFCSSSSKRNSFSATRLSAQYGKRWYRSGFILSVRTAPQPIRSTSPCLQYQHRICTPTKILFHVSMKTSPPKKLNLNYICGIIILVKFWKVLLADFKISYISYYR